MHLCRSWLFVEGANETAQSEAATSGADVLIQELEDFTAPDRRPHARALAPDLYASWRALGAIAAVRVNPLNRDGMDDLQAVMKGRPDIVALPKVAKPEHVQKLDKAVTALERDYGIDPGSTKLLPNIEYAEGLVRAREIAAASPRTIGLLLASEDLAADFGAERGKDGLELSYSRQRFIVECVAAGIIAVDCPYTWLDHNGVERDTKWARRLGYKAKSAVQASHISLINNLLTPSEAEIAEAERIVDAFEKSRQQGSARAELDGSLLEVPTYTNAQRLLKRAAEFRALEKEG